MKYTNSDIEHFEKRLKELDDIIAFNKENEDTQRLMNAYIENQAALIRQLKEVIKRLTL